MKILYVIPNLSNDGPVHALKMLIEGMNEIEIHDISVLTLDRQVNNALLKDFISLGVNVKNIPIYSFISLLNINKIRHLLIREKFDIVSSTCIRADTVIKLACIGLPQQRLFTTVQNVPRDDLGFLFPGWRGRLYAWVHYQVLRSFRNRIICVSRTVRDHLHKEIGMEGAVVFNPVRARAAPCETKCSVPIIVYAASLVNRKNPAEAIDFVTRSLPAGAYRYEVYGRGPLETQLRERYRENGQIAWLGFSEDLSQVFGRSTVYVSSSLSEGFPLTPQLALICGCPCVLSNIPQHREMAELSPFVYLYRAGDQTDFARAIKLALGADRKQAILEGRQFAERVAPSSIAIQIIDNFKKS